MIRTRKNAAFIFSLKPLPRKKNSHLKLKIQRVNSILLHILYFSKGSGRLHLFRFNLMWKRWWQPPIFMFRLLLTFFIETNLAVMGNSQSVITLLKSLDSYKAIFSVDSRGGTSVPTQFICT